MSVGADPAVRTAGLLQMKRIAGQVEGIRRMIEEDRYCADIIVQITAARASLQAVAKALLRDHLVACHHAAVRDGGVQGAAADAMYQELVDLVSKMSR
jgi:DNA-binding FrmR family transcriptional regulator